MKIFLDMLYDAFHPDAGRHPRRCVWCDKPWHAGLTCEGKPRGAGWRPG
jgi:hypothetical protein